MMSPTKKQNPQLSIFALQSRRLVKSFEGLNSSLAQSPGKFVKLQSGGKIVQKYRLNVGVFRIPVPNVLMVQITAII